MMVRDYVRVLREHLVVVVIAVVIGLLGGLATYLLTPAQYSAHLTLYVSSQGDDSTNTALEGNQLSQQRVKSYVELVTSPRVSAEALKKLNLSERPEDLASRITASTPLDSTLINVNVADRSGPRAAALANAIGSAFTDVVSEIERPVAPGGVPAVAVRVVQSADQPTVPSSPGPVLTVVCGLLLGAAVGVGGALARNAFDTSIKTTAQLRDVTGVPNLGTVAFDPQVSRYPLDVTADTRSLHSEAFQRLRTNLLLVKFDKPPKVLVLTSSVPLEGKTTSLVHLAIAMARAGRRVLVIEADLHQPRLADMLGLGRRVGLTNVLSDKLPAERAIQPWGGLFDVLSSGPLSSSPNELLASPQVGVLLRGVRERYDTVLIDSPPLLTVSDAAALASVADGVVLACRHGSVTRADVEAATEALRVISVPLLGTLFTMVPPATQHSFAFRRSGKAAPLAANAYPPPAPVQNGAPVRQAPTAAYPRPNGRPPQLPTRPQPPRFPAGPSPAAGRNPAAPAPAEQPSPPRAGEPSPRTDEPLSPRPEEQSSPRAEESAPRAHEPLPSRVEEPSSPRAEEQVSPPRSATPSPEPVDERDERDEDESGQDADTPGLVSATTAHLSGGRGKDVKAEDQGAA